MFATQIALPNTIEDMVRAYHEGIHEMEYAFELIQQASESMQAVITPHDTYKDWNPIQTVGTYIKPSEVMDKATESWKRDMWRIIIDRSGVRKVMSIKASEQLDKALDNGSRSYSYHDRPKELPDITVENVYSLIQGYQQDAPDIIQEALKEVSEMLRPSSNWHAYKTNDPFKVNKKVILTWKVELNHWGKYPYEVMYRSADKLRALDRVFHLLDGKGVPEGYNSPLIDAINTSPDGKGKTEYFRFQCFKNNNLHIWFERDDLVDELNRRTTEAQFDTPD